MLYHCIFGFSGGMKAESALHSKIPSDSHLLAKKAMLSLPMHSLIIILSIFGLSLCSEPSAWVRDEYGFRHGNKSPEKPAVEIIPPSPFNSSNNCGEYLNEALAFIEYKAEEGFDSNLRCLWVIRPYATTRRFIVNVTLMGFEQSALDHKLVILPFSLADTTPNEFIPAGPGQYVLDGSVLMVSFLSGKSSYTNKTGFRLSYKAEEEGRGIPPSIHSDDVRIFSEKEFTVHRHPNWLDGNPVFQGELSTFITVHGPNRPSTEWNVVYPTLMNLCASNITLRHWAVRDEELTWRHYDSFCFDIGVGYFMEQGIQFNILLGGGKDDPNAWISLVGC